MTPARSTIREILRVLALWIKGQMVIWISATVLYLVGFAIARAPLWPLLAILCGMADPIPHFGALIGLLCVFAFSFLGSGGNLWVMSASLAVWVIVQVIIGYGIGPHVLGRKLGLSPWIVIFGSIFGGLIAGPLGMLIAIPAMAVIAVIVRRWRASHGIIR